MSSHYLPASAGSTSDSNEPECESSGNASLTPSAEPSLSDIGPECPVPPTSPDLTLSGWTWQGFDDYNHIVTGAHNKTLRVDAPWELVFKSFAAASPAKTSQLPESEPALPGKEVDCSMTQHESQTLFSDQEDGSLLRTFPDYFPATKDATSPSYSRRWPTSGFTTSPGECWTADTSECPNGGGEYSSLLDVLEADVPPRFYLSPKAAAGILRRAEKRGKNLPPPLDKALRELSGQAATPDEVDPMTSTDKAPL